MLNNTYHLVKNHPLAGRSITFRFRILDFYLNRETGRVIVKLEDPEGNTQVREYDRRHLYETVDFD